MNESALEALTAPEPNDRQAAVLLIARALHAEHPAMRHANRDDVWAEITRHAAKRDGLPLKRLSDKALTLLCNDIADVWNYIISEGK